MVGIQYLDCFSIDKKLIKAKRLSMDILHTVQVKQMAETLCAYQLNKCLKSIVVGFGSGAKLMAQNGTKQ